MPRLPHSLILHAYNISPLLPLVLRGTRTLEAAINELRWLREHVREFPSSANCQKHQLLRLCERRARGEPLQYLLGSQPFGDLEIQCRPGVLIPRPETEAYTTHLADLLLSGKLHPHLTKRFSDRKVQKNAKDLLPPPALRILDMCSGTGCISLLLHRLLSPKFQNLKIVGMDISPQAIALARVNLASLRRQFPDQSMQQKGKVEFIQHDIFDGLPENNQFFDIIVSNPPYISAAKFNTETQRSVRNWEPKLALVPHSNERTPSKAVACEDFFYRELLTLHNRLVSSSKVLLMEVGDEEQAIRVVKMALGMKRWNIIELWRDWPEVEDDGLKEMDIKGHRVTVKGAGKIRAVVLLRFEPKTKEVAGDGVPVKPVKTQAATQWSIKFR